MNIGDSCIDDVPLQSSPGGSVWEHPPSGTARGGRDESADRRHPLSRVNSQVTEYPELLPFFLEFQCQKGV